VNDPSAARWRKSSRSGGGNNCVELAHTFDQIRDSKNPTGPVLRGNLGALVNDVKGGRYDR
jgi:hypothetical protein